MTCDNRVHRVFLMIELNHIYVENVIIAFNCQDEIPLDDKYEDHQTLYIDI